MKKVVQIVDGYRARDGIGNAALARARALIALGCQVTVICNLSDEEAARPPAATVLTVPDGSAYHQSLMPAAVRQAVIDAEVVILDVGGFSPLFTLAEIKTGRLIVNYHGSTPAALIREPGYTMNWYRGVQVLRHLLKYFDQLVTHSQFIQNEWLATIGSAPADRVIVPLFGATAPASQPKIEPLGSRRLKLLGVGRMFPNKNWELAIRAVDRLRQRGLGARFDHIGGGEDIISQMYRGQLEGLVTGLDLKDRVTLQGGQPQAVLEQAYVTCDAVLLPSLHEGFALPAVEGLAYGKPVFASELGALPETLGGTGYLVNPFDADNLADKITAHFQQPETVRLAHAEKGLARARELSQSAFAKRYVDLVLHPKPVAASVITAPDHQDAANAVLTVELAADYATRMPCLEGTAKVSGLKHPLSSTARLTAHLVDDAGCLLQYDERPLQTRAGPPEAPLIAFRLLLARTERPHRVIFQLAEPSAGDAGTALSGGASTTVAAAAPAAQGHPDLFGRPFVVNLPGRTGEPRPIDHAQQVLALMQQLAELKFSLKYPTGTLTEKIKSFVARNVTARMQSRYVQPHVELQGELNRHFVELLGLILKENDDRAG